jgi:hypothetical protein
MPALISRPVCHDRMVAPIEASWRQSELSAEDVANWQAAGATDPVRTMDLIEAGWTADMAGLVVSYEGTRVTVARAVSLGMTLDAAEQELAASRRI